MKASQGSAAWWVAGLTLAALSLLTLAGARDLTSSSEQVASLDLGHWFSLSNAGLSEFRCRLIVTPLALCWAAATGLIWAWSGWRSSSSSSSKLTFGWHGQWLCSTTIFYLTVDHLLLLWLVTSLHLWMGLAWWRHEQRNAVPRRTGPSSAASGNASALISSQLAADLFNLLGVVILGTSAGTLELPRLCDGDFLGDFVRTSPGAVTFSGLWLTLGFAARCGWYPWIGATQGVRCEGAPSALLFAGIWLPCVGWWWMKISSHFGAAPEIVALIQGWALMSAVLTSLLATAQTERTRVVILLATAQLGLMTAIAVVPGAVNLWELGMAMLSLGYVSAVLMISSGNSHGPVWAWWMLAGCLLSPAFGLASAASERFVEINQAADERLSREHLTDDTNIDPDDDLPPARPLPGITWTAAWCWISACSAYAARRIQRQSKAPILIAVNPGWLEFVVAAGLCAALLWPSGPELLREQRLTIILAGSSGFLGWLIASMRQFSVNPGHHVSPWLQPTSILDAGPSRHAAERIAAWGTAIRQTEQQWPTVWSRIIDRWSDFARNASADMQLLTGRGYAATFGLIVGALILTWSLLQNS